MFKKSILVLSILFVFISVGFTEEAPTIPKGYPVYMFPVIPPENRIQREQIKWAYEQGYDWGLLSVDNLYFPEIKFTKPVIPIVVTAWEMGFTQALIDLQEKE